MTKVQATPGTGRAGDVVARLATLARRRLSFRHHGYSQSSASQGSRETTTTAWTAAAYMNPYYLADERARRVCQRRRYHSNV